MGSSQVGRHPKQLRHDDTCSAKGGGLRSRLLTSGDSPIRRGTFPRLSGLKPRVETTDSVGRVACLAREGRVEPEPSGRNDEWALPTRRQESESRASWVLLGTPAAQTSGVSQVESNEISASTEPQQRPSIDTGVVMHWGPEQMKTWYHQYPSTFYNWNG